MFVYVLGGEGGRSWDAIWFAYMYVAYTPLKDNTRGYVRLQVRARNVTEGYGSDHASYLDTEDEVADNMKTFLKERDFMIGQILKRERASSIEFALVTRKKVKM